MAPLLAYLALLMIFDPWYFGIAPIAAALGFALNPSEDDIAERQPLRKEPYVENITRYALSEKSFGKESSEISCNDSTDEETR